MFNKLKKINHKHILAIIFIIIIFFIGADTFPLVIKDVSGFFNNDKNTLSETKQSIENRYTNMLSFNSSNYLTDKSTYINLNGLMARLMGQRYVNERVKLHNGHLTGASTTPTVKPDISSAVEQMTRLYNKQVENGKHFLFVMAPSQIPKYDDIMPVGYFSNNNSVSDDLLSELDKNGIPVLDLRDEMIKDNIDHDDAFYITDHHWKTETAFWAYTKITDFIVQSGFSQPVDQIYTNIDNYNVVTYKDWFLGSSGKRTGSYYAGVDDFSVIYPKFRTNLSIDVNDGEIIRAGNFKDVVFNMDTIVKDYFTTNPYGSFTHYCKGFTKYNNAAAPLDLKILSIGDSYKDASSVYFPLITNNVDILDMRYYKHDFSEYYSDFDPDIIIMLINATSPVQGNTTYNFFPGE